MISVDNAEGYHDPRSGKIVQIGELYAQNQLIHLQRIRGYKEHDPQTGRPKPAWALLLRCDEDEAERAELKRRLEVFVNHKDPAVYNDMVVCNLRKFYEANFDKGGLAPAPKALTYPTFEHAAKGIGGV